MSKPYILSYDLNSPGQKYDDVKKVIDSFGGSYIKILESTWMLRNNLSPQEMSDRLSKACDKNDSYLIIEIAKNYQGYLTHEKWEFIKENILY
ncbi:hypothetical protein [Fructobacillus evanidus]|uniref:SinR family protein n=1 Tax=Fructobacillus evanidus TaxID=3064281 RepID=A0ABN9YJ63_9LACO|nr:hypothetical protein R55250_KEHBDPNM_00156 [Fructobacillus sp. LMG 32999]CAK1222126.1 hypothetical protein R53718_MFFEMHAI_00157 [Fructobacillus sp. LMG 32999]CAK1226272.1 hypothetical protein R54837_OMAIDLJD_00138 [Fructobacillus sp. LMG 32999]CAK1226481.1 hypothetical protein R53534_HOPDCFKK_00139 [Fructobacillus sp. LMG 32999]CAK1226623.1 hypothetical protein R55214_HHFBAMCI_00149 [Fructobacillus sp. LMG 32999]